MFEVPIRILVCFHWVDAHSQGVVFFDSAVVLKQVEKINFCFVLVFSDPIGNRMRNDVESQ